MVRDKFPEKVTLAIGDGANDCAMIMKAHVGVGIAGKEGMQAARTADYAIGKFMHLRPLMFVHGRECYRRNSDLVCFMFYKNVLFIIVEWYGGYFNNWSGQPFYEQLIYIMYNIAFTSLPIMWYALFDYEFVPEVFNEFPKLFRLGMLNSCFSVWKFWGWIAYAFTQGALVVLFCYYLPSATLLPEGYTYSFWAAGHWVYMICLLLANAIVLRLQSNFTGYGEFVMALAVGGFYVFVYMWQ